MKMKIETGLGLSSITIGVAEIQNINEFNQLVNSYKQFNNVYFTSENTGEILFSSDDSYICEPDFSKAKLWVEEIHTDEYGHEIFYSRNILACSDDWVGVIAQFYESEKLEINRAIESRLDYTIGKTDSASKELWITTVGIDDVVREKIIRLEYI